MAAVVAAGASGVGYRVLAGEQDQPVSQIQPQREAVRAAQSTPAQLAETEARLKAEVSAAEADAARATATLEQLKAKLNDLQRRREEDAAVQRNGQAMASLARRFRYRVPVEIGFSESKNEGGNLEILEVWGTRPKIEIGGQYVVRGKYVLPQEGTLYFYEDGDRQLEHWRGATVDPLLYAYLGQPIQGWLE